MAGLAAGPSERTDSMLTRTLGIDLEAVFMTMLALVGLYLVLTRASALNAIIRSVSRASVESLVVLQGRSPKTVLYKA
jgi:hypothetical protein